MGDPLSVSQIRRLRARAQLLGDAAIDDPVAAVRAIVGVQAQAAAPARLAVRARTHGVDAASVDAATGPPRPALVRSWLMRGTLHAVAVEDLRWLTALLGPLNIRADARRRSELDLSDRVCERALDVLPDVLIEPLPRAEVINRLRQAGVRVSGDGQAPAHLLMFAACSGLICRGPDRAGDEPTYVLADTWLPAGDAGPRDRDDGLRELADRYLRAFGPARVEDFATWSGLPKGDARAAVGSLDGARAVPTQVGDLWAHPATLTALESGALTEASDQVRLLGAFDPYVLGYRSRETLMDPQHEGKVRGGGMIAATILVDAELVGTWKLDRRPKRGTVALAPFRHLPPRTLDAVQAEVDDLARFLGQELVVVGG